MRMCFSMENRKILDSRIKSQNRIRKFSVFLFSGYNFLLFYGFISFAKDKVRVASQGTVQDHYPLYVRN